MPHFPCYQFISDRLAQSKIYIIFILSSNEPFYIPVWSVSREALFEIVRIFRKACQRFPTVPKWATRIASLRRNELYRLEPSPLNAYLVRRSLIQHDPVFSGEGLCLLNLDYIFTFKQRIHTLSETSLHDKDYKRQLDSCVQLLRQVNWTYRGVKLSRSYLERAYGITFQESTLNEICKAYHQEFSEPGVEGMELMMESGLPNLPELESPTNGRNMDFLPLPEYLITREEIPVDTHDTHTEPDETYDIDIWSLYEDSGAPLVTYPQVPTLTKTPDLSRTASPPSPLSIITTAICSRCLADIDAPKNVGGQEMTMFMGPEWENFRRVGLGIIRC
ncbi:MAG: hypothetical protein Q9222_005307 [Ikaeria aurantiellina]